MEGVAGSGGVAALRLNAARLDERVAFLVRIDKLIRSGEGQHT
jgi:hypothetical protein